MIRKGVRIAAILGIVTACGLGLSIRAAGDTLQPGVSAPDFTLPSQEDTSVSLSQYKGKWVVLWFYPKDMTTGCTIQAHNFERDLPKYAALNAVVLGVSLDTVESHKTFCSRYSLTFRLLADTDHKVVDAYGVRIVMNGPLKFAERDTFLISPSGNVVKVWTSVNPNTDSDEVLEAIAALSPSQSHQSAQQPDQLDSLSIAALQQRANAGDSPAQALLGYKYATGEGVPKDAAQAVAWFRKAAALGNPEGEYDLGMMYAEGQGVSLDYVQAAAWYRKAADHGSALAQTSLGIMYENGRGVVQDYAQALTWFSKAADQADPVAQANVGLIYQNGWGVPRDNAQAALWYRKAADQKYQPAQDALAKLDPAPATPLQSSAAVPVITSLASSPTRGGVPEPSPADSVAAAVAIPHNYALIFATDDYTNWPHLANPIPDADAVNDTLTSLYGFHVEEVRNASDDQILAKLTEYLHRTFEPQDQLLIFFSGHGYFDPDLGKGFLVPANALAVKDDVGHRTLLAHETIMGYVNRIPSKHVVLVLDACFAGTLDRRIADSGLRGDPTSDPYAHASLPELLARKEPKRTRRYITSGGKDFVPDGLPGHHSPFISAMLTTLNEAADRKGYVTLDDIQQGLDAVKPEPRWGEIQDDNEPGADILLLTPNAVAQLGKPQ